jgi:transmembrane sensor
METSFQNSSSTEDLIIKYLAGSANAEERDVVMQFINSTFENRKYFDSIREAYLVSKIAQEISETDKEQSWQRIRGGYYKELYLEEKEQIKRNRRKLIWRISIPAAAAVLAAFILGFYSFRLSDAMHSDRSIVMNEVVAPKGSRTQVILSDGSKVWLNAGSRLRYPSRFGNASRNVYLEGEAFFDVSHNMRKQFIVNAGTIKVRVFGTQFNVKAYPEEDVISTTLIKGSVAIDTTTDNSKAAPVYLHINQTATYYKKHKPTEALAAGNVEKPEQMAKAQVSALHLNIIQINDPEPITSWKDEKWIIEGLNLGEMATQLERRYNVQITFKNEDLKKYKFSGILTNETFEQVLTIIKISAPVNFTLNQNNVVFSEDPAYRKKYDSMIKHKP